MRFDDFYYFAEGKREEQKLAREELWKIILNSKALKDVDIQFKDAYFDNNSKRNIEQIRPYLGRESLLLYVADEKKIRATVSKEVAKILKSKGLNVEYTFIKSRPVLIVSKDGVSLKFEFKENLKNKVKAVDYEYAIVQVWNNEPVKKLATLEPAENIVNQLKEKIKINVEANHSGSKQLGPATLTPFWVEGYDRPDRTPKPDFNFSEKYRISLKIGTAALLCSSKIIGAEGNKLIISSLEGTKVDDEVKRKIESMVSKRFERPEGEDTEKVLARSASDIAEFGSEYFEEQHEILTKLLEDAANSDIQFKKNFIYEAMTGNKKFKIDEGKANWILSAPYDGSFINFKPVSRMNLNKLVKQCRLYVSFKSSGKSKSSVVRGAVPIEKPKTESKRFTLEYFEMKADELGIDHRTLNEGIFDGVKKVFNIIKDALAKGLKWILGLFGIEGKVENLNQENLNFLNL